MTEGQVASDLERARALLKSHPVLGPLALRVRVNRRPGNPCPADAWGVVTSKGRVFLHPDRSGTEHEWLRVLAHLLLHLGLGHVQARDQQSEWNAACDVVASRLLLRLGLLRKDEGELDERWDDMDENALYLLFRAEGIPEHLSSPPDLLPEPPSGDEPNWTYLLGKGLRLGTQAALTGSSCRQQTGRQQRASPAQQARSWFIREYPLLGAIASAFTIVEDAAICGRYGITIAAIHPALREIYINPAAGLDEAECRFVVAHELLHAGLLHHRRRAWRRPFLWNVACDYIVNHWLVEMGVGMMPALGGYHDVALDGLSAEYVYDRIATRVDELRHCGTFRGIGVGDILSEDGNEADADLDAFLRRCLAKGLDEHFRRGRGTAPSGLIEEVRGRLRPAISWDVELGRWCDSHLAPLIVRRSYARLSRRQSATPDIPRPRVAPFENDARTLGVVLDTSGSMDREILASALGAIAGYALSRDVPGLRLVFCDAEPYDRGYLPPEALLTWVDIRGRGGTVLQPAIELLEDAADFPATCPILIVTDGYCDELRTDREHAFLVPWGHSLPCHSAAPVFEMAN